MRLAIDGSIAIDHRIEAADETQINVSALRGAGQLTAPRTIGRTLSLTLEPRSREYELAYTVQRIASLYRCPVWVPAVPADGVSRQMRISVELPPGTSPRGTMPAFIWKATTGTTTLGHIPAFVRVPFAPHGTNDVWDVSTTMDVLTIAVFAAASSIWIWRRKR